MDIGLLLKKRKPRKFRNQLPKIWAHEQQTEKKIGIESRKKISKKRKPGKLRRKKMQVRKKLGNP